MEFQKVTNFLDVTSDNKNLPKFITKKWIEVYDQSDKNYDPNKEIRIKTSMLRYDLCDFSDAYIAVKGNVTVIKKPFTANDFERPNNTNLNATNTNNATNITFGEKSWFLKIMHHLSIVFQIYGVKIDNTEDLDVVMSMYNLLEYSKNYKKPTGSLKNYYRDEPNSGTDNNNNNNNNNNNKNIIHSILKSESFDYNANFMKNGVTQNNLTI